MTNATIDIQNGIVGINAATSAAAAIFEANFQRNVHEPFMPPNIASATTRCLALNHPDATSSIHPTFQPLSVNHAPLWIVRVAMIGSNDAGDTSSSLVSSSSATSISGDSTTFMMR